MFITGKLATANIKINKSGILDIYLPKGNNKTYYSKKMFNVKTFTLRSANFTQ
ncbi:hypothetical protein wScaTNS_05740 [Wolbachia pipientis]